MKKIFIKKFNKKIFFIKKIILKKKFKKNNKGAWSCFIIALKNRLKFYHGGCSGSIESLGFCSVMVSYLIGIFGTIVSLPFTILFFLVEFLRVLIWVFTLFHCFHSTKFCWFRNVAKKRSFDSFELKPLPPYDIRQFDDYKNSYNSRSYIISVEEDLSCCAATAICFYGADVCKKKNYFAYFLFNFIINFIFYFLIFIFVCK